MTPPVSHTQAPPATLLIRLMVGGIFFSEGLQKFLYADEVGAGRFLKIGLPSPEILAPFVGSVEMACGLCILFGLLTRLAVMPLLGVIIVAFLTTKVPVLLGHEVLGFSLKPLPRYGFLSMLHEARTDLSMICGLLFIVLVGPGPLSLDALRTGRRSERNT
jgi:putative oxidoreductase